MSLFDLFKKRKAPQSQGKDLSKLTKDGELPYGWHYANREFTKQIEEEYDYFSEAACNAKKNGVRAEYEALMSLVRYRKDVQQLCASKGESYVFWADICVTNPISMENDLKRLRYLEENMEDFLKHEKTALMLRKELINIIKNEPGIVQSDIYKRYDPSWKNTISNELYAMETDSAIVREKSGRSYKLYIK